MSKFGTEGRVRLRISARFAEYGDVGIDPFPLSVSSAAGGREGPIVFALTETSGVESC